MDRANLFSAGAAVCLAFVCAGCSNPADRKQAELYVERGQTFRSQGNFPEASRAFASAVASDPSFAQAHLDLGLEYLRFQTHIDKAIEQFEQALELDPELWIAKHYWIEALRLSGRIPEALELQRELLAEQPNRPEFHCYLAGLLCEQKKFKEAIPGYRQALELKSDYSMARAGLGVALVHTGDLAGGIAALREAIGKLEDSVPFRRELVRALIEAKRPDEALAEAKAALELEPRNAMVYHSVAEAFAARGELDEARAWAEKTLAAGCALSPELRAKLR